MGSLASRPNAPAVQTVYMPVYTPSAPSTPVATTPVSAAPDMPSSPVETPDEQSAARRGAGLLERRRGVLSTVLTGFRGLLNQTLTPQRKSLLGE